MPREGALKQGFGNGIQPAEIDSELVSTMPAAGACNGDAAAFRPWPPDSALAEWDRRPSGVPWWEVGDGQPISSAFLVNTSDHLKIATNGKYKSVLHRAVVNNRATRMSIAIANGPSPDSLVCPAEELLKLRGDRAAYVGMKYREYLELQQGNILDGKSWLNRAKIE